MLRKDVLAVAMGDELYAHLSTVLLEIAVKRTWILLDVDCNKTRPSGVGDEGVFHVPGYFGGEEGGPTCDV